MSRNTFDRLFDRAMIQSNGCWEFSGARYYNGYGVMRVNGRNIGTHRLAYILCIDDIPEGMIVCHKCDNPPCVNPEHLFLGTKRDNTQDMICKGRQGEGYARINQEIANDIRTKLEAGATGISLALKYNISTAAISMIRNNITWRI